MKRKVCISLAVLAVTLAMMVSSGFAANGGSTQGNDSAVTAGKYFQGATMTVCQGGILSVTMVSGSTDLQFLPTTDTLGTQGLTIKQIQPIIAVNPIANLTAQDASPIVGSGAIVVIVKTFAIAQPADVVSSGGNSFHAGKFFASAGTDMIVTSAEKPANLDNLKGGGSFHVGKHFAPATDAAKALIIT